MLFLHLSVSIKNTRIVDVTETDSFCFLFSSRAEMINLRVEIPTDKLQRIQETQNHEFVT